jgi:hypothetical protein
MNTGKPEQGERKNFTSSFNQRAKGNFKYWTEDKKYQGLPAKHTIRGKMHARGVPGH